MRQATSSTQANNLCVNRSGPFPGGSSTSTNSISTKLGRIFNLGVQLVPIEDQNRCAGYYSYCRRSSRVSAKVPAAGLGQGKRFCAKGSRHKFGRALRCV